MAVNTSAPTGPVRSGGANVGPGGVAPWAIFSQQTREHVAELMGQRAVLTYERMVSGDAQLWGLYSGLVQPIELYDWWVDPNGNDEALVALLAEDLGLPVGKPSGDGQQHTSLPDAFDFGEALHEALLAPVLSHYYFEWSGEIRDGLWRLTEMASLHPATLSTIKSDRRGRLEYVSQGAAATFSSSNGTLMANEPPRIGPESLVPFVFWPDATRRWTGRSLLRPLYRNWLCKDVLLRVDVTNHERAGGVPWISTDQTFAGANLDDLSRLAQEFRVDEEGGAALPPGAMLNLARAGGTDIIASVNYHDGQMSKVWQTMVRDLGQTATGNRALGEVQVDLEAMARQSIAAWAAKTMNRWVLARWWDWNTGQGHPPVLRFTPPAVEGSVDAEPAPAAGDDGGPPPVAAAGSPSSRAKRARHAAAATDVPEGSRFKAPPFQTHRQPSDIEVRAATDFEQLSLFYESADEALSRTFLDVILPEQIDAVREAIEFTQAGTPRQRITALDMARIRIPVVGTDDLLERMLTVATDGAMAAHAELEAQGLTSALPDEATLRAAVTDHARAVSRLLADGVGIATTRRAVQLSASGMSATALADDVTGYLRDLSHDWERRQLSGAVQQALMAGRMQTWEAAGDAPVSYYISSLLDGNACSPCIADDGREFATLAEVRQVMPTGGNKSCLGGPRCRCTAVAVYAETPYGSATTV